jgi:hypothetical protein
MIIANGLANSNAAMAATGLPPNTTGWMDCSGYAAPLSVTIEGAAAGDAIEIRVSNNPIKPSDDNQGVLYGSAVVATGKVEILSPYRWIRINRSTAAGSPAIVSAWLAAARVPSN